MIANPLYIRGATTRYDADAGKSNRSHIAAYNGTADTCLSCTKKDCGGGKHCRLRKEAKKGVKAGAPG